jgi:nucleotide-binding universal stress UspA family protein
MSILPATPITVLAAIDFSATSSLVVQQALEAGRQTKVEEVHFLHVNPVHGGDSEYEQRRVDLQEWLAARLSGADAVPPTIKVVAHEAVGNAADVIVEMASDLLAALVVVGTHGRTGLQRMVMGSVAEAVVRRAGCPVLVVRPQSHHEAGPSIEPPCPRCVQARVESKGQELWCEQHTEKHGRRHTYFNTRHETWVNHRITL